jgi:hypothetical protein
MLSVFTLADSEEWDKIVLSMPKYDVYYLSSYVRAFQKHGDGDPLLFYFDNGRTRAINVVMKRDIANCPPFKDKIVQNQWFDLTTPYGYGGFLIDGDDYDGLDEVYTEYCKKANIISEFVRFHPMLGNGHNVKEVYQVQELGSTVYIDLTCSEKIWESFTSKNRNVVRRAKKLGVEIYWGRSISLFREFEQLYNRTMDSHEADPYYYFSKDFYDSILYDLRNNAMIFYATYEGKIISMAIIMFCNTQMHYHLSASDYNFRNVGATNLLLYETALWGNANGYRTFHLGGGLGSSEDSLFKFKKSFNRYSERKFSIGKKCFNAEIYEKLVEIRKSENDFNDKSTFFPLYRS